MSVEMSSEGRKYLVPGKTLKQLKREIEELTKKTGHYAGLKELELKNKEPSKYELLHARIIAALIAAREQCKMIAASPLTREVGELLVTFYTPDGDCVAYSTGIQIHGHLVGEFIKWMIENDYEERVGIKPGDVFVHNDGAIAAMHPADIYDVMPVFYKDELVGWVATVIMETDVGEEYMMGDTSYNRTTDGLRVAGLKEAENYRLKPDVEEFYRRLVRNVDMFLLDRKGAISADIRFEQEVRKIIDEFGIDFFRRAIREIIEDERRRMRARIKERLVPGRYRSLTCADIFCRDLPVPEYSAKDWLRIMPFEVTITKEGTGIVDYEGVGEWGWHSMNSVIAGQYGGLTISLVQRLSYEGWANAGTIMDWEIRAPKNSLVNPPEDMLKHISFANVWVPAITSWGAAFQAILSRAIFSRGFVEEVMLGNGRTPGWELMGINQLGQMYVFALALPGGPGMGARGCLDGEDSCYQVWNQETDNGNLEVFELLPPYCAEIRVIPNSGGAGRWRGGNDAVLAGNIYGTDFTSIASMAITCTWITAPNTQIFGGYPGPVPTYFVVRNPKEKWAGGRIDLKELALTPWNGSDPVEYLREKAPEAEIHVVKRMKCFQVRDGDVVIAIGFSGNGGLGDPIEREPELVEKDLNMEKITPEAAERIYKVACTFDEVNKTYRVDEKRTEELREKERKDRLKRGVPVREWWKKQREIVLKKQFHELLLESYRSSFKVSERWAREFREFWNLPEDFRF
jgi:acetone carboxylase alpha subunit